MWAIFGKPLKRAIRNTPGLHAVLTRCFRFSSFLDGVCLSRCLVLLTGSYCVFIYIFPSCAVASLDAPQKPLVRKRARSGGAESVQVSRHQPGSQAKPPCTAKSQQPACPHKEHIEVTAFAAQFWDRKTHPTKASQQQFLATCIDVGVDKNVKYKY